MARTPLPGNDVLTSSQIRSRTLEEVIVYYYKWKLSERGVAWAQEREARSERVVLGRSDTTFLRLLKRNGRDPLVDRVSLRVPHMHVVHERGNADDTSLLNVIYVPRTAAASTKRELQWCQRELSHAKSKLRVLEERLCECECGIDGVHGKRRRVGRGPYDDGGN